MQKMKEEDEKEEVSMKNLQDLKKDMFTGVAKLQAIVSHQLKDLLRNTQGRNQNSVPTRARRVQPDPTRDQG